jgi:hypothetical protein
MKWYYIFQEMKIRRSDCYQLPDVKAGKLYISIAHPKAFTHRRITARPSTDVWPQEAVTTYYEQDTQEADPN